MTDHLEIPTVISSDDPADTLKMLRGTFALAQQSIASRVQIPELAGTHNARLDRLIADIDRQLDAETDAERWQRAQTAALQAEQHASDAAATDALNRGIRDLAQTILDEEWEPEGPAATAALRVFAAWIIA